VPRRTADETRHLLIDTGIAMLHERGVTAGVAHIRLQDVLKRAGLTTGAAYRLWDHQEDFHRDLAAAATRSRDDVPITRTIAAIRDLVDRRAPLREVIRVAAATHVDGLGAGGDGAFLTTLALRATAGHQPELQAASRARHNESIDSFAQLYDTLMKVYGRRLRPPFTLRQFTVAMAALGEGFALHAIEGEEHPVVEVSGPGGGPPEAWTLFGVSVEALVELFTEPAAAAAACPDQAADQEK
jgi:AcrR family transcriptional regulator